MRCIYRIAWNSMRLQENSKREKKNEERLSWIHPILQYFQFLDVVVEVDGFAHGQRNWPENVWPYTVGCYVSNPQSVFQALVWNIVRRNSWPRTSSRATYTASACRPRVVLSIKRPWCCPASYAIYNDSFYWSWKLQFHRCVSGWKDTVSRTSSVLYYRLTSTRGIWKTWAVQRYAI